MAKMSDVPPECYLDNPSPYRQECMECEWLWVCVALVTYRTHGMFAKSEGTMSMFITPEIVETEDWSDRLDKFPIADTLEDIDWDLLYSIAKDNLKERYHMAEDFNTPYSICIWCTYLKVCNGSLMSFLKAKKVIGCNMYRLHFRSDIDILPSEITRGDKI